MLRGKFREPKAYIKTQERSHTIELTEHLKTLEQKEKNSLRQEITKLRTKINKIKKRKQYKESMRQREKLTK